MIGSRAMKMDCPNAEMTLAYGETVDTDSGAARRCGGVGRTG